MQLPATSGNFMLAGKNGPAAFRQRHLRAVTIAVGSFATSSSSFFSKPTTRYDRLAQQLRGIATTQQAGSKQQIALQRQAQVVLTKKLKGCRSSQEMLAVLQSYVNNHDVGYLTSIHIATVFTRLPRFGDSLEDRLKVAQYISPALDRLDKLRYPHPDTGQASVWTIANVAWGLIAINQGNDVHCRNALQLLDEHLEELEPVGLATAMDCFVKVGYTSETLKPSRIASCMRSIYMDANGQDVARFLYDCDRLGITDPALKLLLAERLLQVVNQAQHCSNAALALSRKPSADAERLVVQLVQKMLQLKDKPRPQAVANTFLVLHKADWAVERWLALGMLHAVLDSQWDVNAIDCLQILTGLECHGVQATDIDLTPLVQVLVLRCPHRMKPQLASVVSSLKHIGYPNAQQLAKLSKMAGTIPAHCTQ